MSFWFNALMGKSMTLLEPSRITINENHLVSQYKNRRLIKKIARNCGLRLSGFRSDEHLEIYYDIRRADQDLGSIAKGWDDPGFRIGDFIILPMAKVQAFKSNVNEILHYCATNGMPITTSIEREGFVIAIDSVIYCGGLNELTLPAMLSTLRECIEKIHSIVNRREVKGLSIVRPLPFH